MQGPIPDSQVSRLVNRITGHQTHTQRHIAAQHEKRMKKFISEIPKNFVTREEYDQMVVIVNALVEKVNQLDSTSTGERPVPPPPPKKK